MSTANTVLIEKSRSGDRESFGQIVRQYQGIVSGIIYGILGDFHKSEDIAQETFLIAWKKLDELRDVEKLPGWLCGIARNLANHYRVKQPKIQTVSVAEAVEIAEQKDDPARILAQNEQNRLIWGALEKIPEKYRIPLVLYYRSEKSIPEIADALEISKDVLAMRLTRARKYLRLELEKQVKGAIAANGPGEFFSLAVIAALPAIASISTVGKAIAATALGTTAGTEATFAASAMVAAPKSGSSGAALFGASFFGATCSVLLWIVSASLFAIFFILGAIPGIWFSVRNAPTLRTRRYLILCSLRAHMLIAFACFLVWALAPTCQGIIALVRYCDINVSYATEWTRFITDVWTHFTTCMYTYGSTYVLAYGSIGLLPICVVLFMIVSLGIYRRILREDSGLAVPKKTVPLEESSLSSARLEKTCKRFSTVCLVMLIWFFASYFFRIFLMATRISPYWFDLHNEGIMFGFMVVGIVFYVTFRQFHKQLLASAKDEATFHAIGPLWDRKKTPFVERVFVEWLVYLGCFVTAGLIFVLQLRFGFSFGYEYPIPLSLKLVLILAGSVVLAAINACFPRLRWLVILGGCFLVVKGINDIYYSPWEHGRSAPWLDLPNQWPCVFTVIWLNIYATIAIFATLILGGRHYYAKWNGKSIRFSLPKKMVTVYCIIGVLLLCFAPHWYSSFRVPYWCNRFTFAKDDNAGIEMCNEVMRLSPENSFFHIFSLGRRGYHYTQMKEYSLALADYDAVIRLNEMQPDTENTRQAFRVYHGSRGNVKLALGDLHGAIADYTSADPSAFDRDRRRMLYHRGYAYELLGETEKAIADYTAVIELLEKANYWEKYITPIIPRPDGNNPSRVTLEELKKIRDHLKEEK
ncbi:MAG: sigma-70 family RNA polymerase sigma factor [Planctomycetaceae bacterium]|nr:sigma-70 family RNA polymerase sigma factor [Planctomycetaceae bacterium]